MHRSAPFIPPAPARITPALTALGVGLIAAMTWPGCASSSSAKPEAAASETAAGAKAARRKTPDRPESADDTATPASEKSQFDAAAMDLQSLFNEQPAATDGTAQPATAAPPVRAPKANVPKAAKAEANMPRSLDAGVALDALSDDSGNPAPKPTQPGVLTASTTVLPTPEPAPPLANPQDAREAASLGIGLTPERPGAATAQTPKPPVLHTGTIALCQRVESFGRFTPLPSNKFIAGRPALMILYTELVDFAQREELASESGVDTHHVVEVSQQVDLLLDSDGSRQFGAPEQVVRDISRTPRRDFFIVQRVELPRNLSVGKYNFKVTLRDKISGAEAEKIVPILIVADPTIAKAAETDSGIITPESVRAAALPPPAPRRQRSKP